MNYSEQLIAAVKAAKGFKTDKALAQAMGVTPATLNIWKKGTGSPMPEGRVIDLCAMANIADPAPWLAGVHADGVRDAEARKLWESLLDRLRPSIATAMLGAVLLGTYALPSPTRAAILSQPEQSQVIGIMRNVGRWLRKAFAAFTRRFEHGPAHPAPAVLA